MNMLKKDLKTLKVYIYSKKKQFNAYCEMKACLNKEDIIFHVDFTESHRNDQEDVIHKVRILGINV